MHCGISAWIHRSAIAVVVLLTRPGFDMPALVLGDGGAAVGGDGGLAAGGCAAGCWLRRAGGQAGAVGVEPTDQAVVLRSGQVG